MGKKTITGTKNVYELAQERLKVIFNEFDNIYVSFSGGKDSGVLLNMCILRSILDSLLPLGEEVHVYPGHGPETTIGHETLYNPFIVEVLNDEVNYKN